MEYERAARLRDDIGALQRAMEQNAVVFRDGTDADVIALAEDPLEVAVQIFHVRGGRVRGQRGWVADRFDDARQRGADRAVPAPALRRRRPDRPDRDAVPREILVPVLPPVDGVAHPDADRTAGLGRARSGCRSAATSGR